MMHGSALDGSTRVELTEMVERMSAATEALEAAVERISDRELALREETEQRIAHITATVESAREAELEEKLAEAEKTIAELRAAAAGTGARKTAVATTMLAKGEALEAASLDAALVGLSVEQRIAVKAAMLRGGLLR